MSFLKFLSNVGTEMLKVAEQVNREEKVTKINRECSRILTLIDHQQRAYTPRDRISILTLWEMKKLFSGIVGKANKDGATPDDIDKAHMNLDFYLDRYAQQIKDMGELYAAERS